MCWGIPLTCKQTSLSPPRRVCLLHYYQEGKLDLVVLSLADRAQVYAKAAHICSVSAGIAVADLDMGYLEKVRERMPMAQHRRQGRVCMGWDQPSHEEQTSGVLPGVA